MVASKPLSSCQDDVTLDVSARRAVRDPSSGTDEIAVNCHGEATTLGRDQEVALLDAGGGQRGRRQAENAVRAGKGIVRRAAIGQIGESAAAEARRHKTDALHASIAASRKVRDGHQGGTPVRTNGPDLAAELVGRDQRASERAELRRSNGYSALDQWR